MKRILFLASSILLIFSGFGFAKVQKKTLFKSLSAETKLVHTITEKSKTFLIVQESNSIRILDESKQSIWNQRFDRSIKKLSFL